MNLEQAFKILNEAIASINTTRQGHQVLNQALQAMLSAATAKPEEKKPDLKSAK